MIKIHLPSLSDQQRAIYESQVKKACEMLCNNLKAKDLRETPPIPADFEASHLKEKKSGWTAPEPEIVNNWFRRFQEAFPEYGTDQKLAELLGVVRVHSIREWRRGDKQIPYGIWRHFLVLTGKVVQDIIPVMAFL